MLKTLSSTVLLSMLQYTEHMIEPLGPPWVTFIITTFADPPWSAEISSHRKATE
jgi:hypothetical protein